jgi:hypothetical protein
MIAKQILVFFLTKIFNLRKTTKNKLKNKQIEKYYIPGMMSLINAK